MFNEHNIDEQDWELAEEEDEAYERKERKNKLRIQGNENESVNCL